MIIETFFMAVLLYADFHNPGRSWTFRDWPIDLLFSALFFLPLIALILPIIVKNKGISWASYIIAFGVLAFWLFTFIIKFYEDLGRI